MMALSYSERIPLAVLIQSTRVTDRRICRLRYVNIFSMTNIAELHVYEVHEGAERK